MTTVIFDYTLLDAYNDSELEVEIVAEVYHNGEVQIETCSYWSDYWQRREEHQLTTKQEERIADRALDIFYSL